MIKPMGSSDGFLDDELDSILQRKIDNYIANGANTVQAAYDAAGWLIELGVLTAGVALGEKSVEKIQEITNEVQDLLLNNLGSEE